jgi:hypothetical protein
MTFISFIILIFNLLVATDVVRILGIKRISFALLLSPAILISFYTLLFNLLGLFNSITFFALVVFEFLLFFLYSFFRVRKLLTIVLSLFDFVRREKIYFLILLPLLFLILISAIYVVPNNMDSMAYHMARVIQWMQNQNIDYYFTYVDRQNRMGPGAEVLILLFQILSSTDKFANSIQFISFLIFCFSLPDLLRFVGVKNRNRVLYVSILVVSTPMLLLQASTTQNDLLSGVLMWSIVLVLLKTYRRRPQLIPIGLVLLIAIVFAAAYLTKPTSILTLLPLIVYGSVRYLIRFVVPISIYARKLTILIAVFFVLIAPDVYRKVSYLAGNNSFHELYPLTEEWGSSRFFNVFLSGMHHSPFNYTRNNNIIESVSGIVNADYDKASIETNWNFFSHEDYIGNPFQFFVFVLMTFVGLIAIVKSRFKEKYIIALLPVCSFVLLGLFIRDNPWLSRIQLPFFLLIPMCFISLDAFKISRFLRTFDTALLAFSFFGLSVSFLVISQSTNKPISLFSILSPGYVYGDRDGLYYLTNKELKEEHDHVIRFSQDWGVKIVGIVAGGNFYEYPLSWRLYQQKMKLVHLDTVQTFYPDLIYIEAGIVWRPNLMKYQELGERIYLLRKPIKTLAVDGKLDVPLTSLIFSNSGIVNTERGVFFYGNGTASTGDITFKEGSYLINILSQGANLNGDGSHLNVIFNKEKLLQINSLGANQNDSLIVNIDKEGENRLEIEFDNDLYDASRNIDRNAEVSKILILKKN